MADAPPQPDVESLLAWALEKVDNPDFESWKAATLTNTDAVVQEARDYKCLYARLDIEPESLPLKRFYVKADSRADFASRLGASCLMWADIEKRERPEWNTSAFSVTFAKISYKGVVWNIGSKP